MATKKESLINSQEIELQNSFELTRLSEHYQTMNGKINGIESDIKEIKNAILGNEFEDEGITKRLKALKNEVEKIKEDQIKNKLYFNQFKWFVTVIGGTILAILIKQFSQK
jgi:chromosome segregation ATPase